MNFYDFRLLQGKIHAVHIAAKEGNLRDLQNALDRRKFAIARDNASPHGATALHVAIVFGHTAIIRYLLKKLLFLMIKSILRSKVWF